MELLEVADRFEIPSLRDISVERLLRLVDIYSVCYIISVAEMLPSCKGLYLRASLCFRLIFLSLFFFFFIN